MQSTHNFIEYVSKSNTGFLNAINVFINLWNNLHNQVEDNISYASYKLYTKSIFIKMCK